MHVANVEIAYLNLRIIMWQKIMVNISEISSWDTAYLESRTANKIWSIEILEKSFYLQIMSHLAASFICLQ
jgi:hypothetical protein